MKTPLCSINLKDGRSYDVILTGEFGPSEYPTAIFHQDNRAEVLEVLRACAQISDSVEPKKTQAELERAGQLRMGL